MVDGEPINVYEPVAWVPIFSRLMKGILVWIVGTGILTIGIELYTGYQRIVSGILAGIVVLIPVFLYVGWEYYKWKVIEYRVYDDKIEERVGVYNQNERSVGFDEISKIHKSQTVFESKILGIANISLDTPASEEPAITMVYVGNADEAYENLNARVDDTKPSKNDRN